MTALTSNIKRFHSTDFVPTKQTDLVMRFYNSPIKTVALDYDWMERNLNQNKPLFVEKQSTKKASFFSDAQPKKATEVLEIEVDAKQPLGPK